MLSRRNCRTGDPVLDLIGGIVYMAQQDARNGDEKAAAWLFSFVHESDAKGDRYGHIHKAVQARHDSGVD